MTKNGILVAVIVLFLSNNLCYGAGIDALRQLSHLERKSAPAFIYASVVGEASCTLSKTGRFLAVADQKRKVTIFDLAMEKPIVKIEEPTDEIYANDLWPPARIEFGEDYACVTVVQCIKHMVNKVHVLGFNLSMPQEPTVDQYAVGYGMREAGEVVTLVWDSHPEASYSVVTGEKATQQQVPSDGTNITITPDPVAALYKVPHDVSWLPDFERTFRLRRELEDVIKRAHGEFGIELDVKETQAAIEPMIEALRFHPQKITVAELTGYLMRFVSHRVPIGEEQRRQLTLEVARGVDKVLKGYAKPRTAQRTTPTECIVILNGDSGSQVLVYRTNAGSGAKPAVLGHFTGKASCTLSETGRLLAVADEAGKVTIFELATGKLVMRAEEPASPIYKDNHLHRARIVFSECDTCVIFVKEYLDPTLENKGRVHVLGFNLSRPQKPTMDEYGIGFAMGVAGEVVILFREGQNWVPISQGSCYSVLTGERVTVNTRADQLVSVVKAPEPSATPRASAEAI